MTNYVVLNQEQHGDLKVITERSADYGDSLKYAMTFPFEFRNIQGNYPIFFQKDSETGSFYALALFGFENNENLFLSDSGWNAPYIPIMIKRQPFLIGYQETGGDSGESPEQKKAVVSIDLDNPRVNKEQGESLFQEHGGTSEFLQNSTKMLEVIHQSHEHGKAFTEALVEHELLEPFTLEIDLADGSKNQLLGFYTINEEKLQGLGGEALAKLNDKGFLMPIYMVLASHSCIRSLADLKNVRL